VVQSFREVPPYCPRGQSAWELTVQGEAGKLNDDFTKRTTSPPPPVQPGATTYVAVTARRFPPKLQWATDRRALGKWIDVRLLDADDLATWLSQAPAVARWFAVQLDKPAYDLLDLDAFLARWRRRTAPPLPIELALAGRERGRAAEHVRDWARAVRPQPLVIQGDTQEEALLFAAAALALAPAAEGDFWRARTLVVESAEALRWASRIVAAESLILLPSFEGPLAALVESKAHIVVPLDRSTSGAVRLLLLEPAPHRRFAEILADAGFPRDEAERRAAESGGKLSSLARLYGYVALPGWATSLAPVPLATMLLIGAFQPENEADREVVRLLGAEPRDVEGLCERLRIIPDAAMERDQEHWGRAVWTWRAPGDAWKHLVGSIPAETLRRFESTASKVLGMRDPRFDLHPDERFAAQVHGKVLLESPALRESMARSLVRLSMSDADLVPLHGARRGSGLAETVVRRLLQAAWQHWASVADLLPLLAEAAPEVFLDCLEVSLRHGDEGAAHLLAEEGQFGSPHTGLLFALETLGWSEHYMARVASALVDLAAYDLQLPDVPGRLANRPVASVHKLLHLSFAQTRASAAARRATWRRLIERQVGYEFAIGQIGSVGRPGFMLPARAPAFRDWMPPSEEELQRRAAEEYSENVETLVNLAIEHAGKDALRWVQLLHATEQLPEALKIRILGKLEASRFEIVDANGGIWAELRRWLHFGTSDVNPMENRGEWYGRAKRLYHEAPFLPDDLVVQTWWLFEPMVEPPDREGFLTDDDDELKARRAAALAQIWADPRRRDLLARLVSFNKSTGVTEHVIGRALGQAEFAAEVERELLGDNPGELAALLPSYVGGRLMHSQAPDWLEHLLRRLIEEQRLAAASEVARFQRPTNELWSTIAKIGEPLHSAYWRDVSYVADQAPDHDWGGAISQLLRFGNVAVALDAVEQGGANVSTDVVNEVLRALRDSPEQTQRVFNHRLHRYRIERVLARFDNDATADLELFGHFAMLVAEAPTGRRRSSKFLSSVLEKEFVSLVARIYRGDDEDDATPGSADEARKSNASTAFRRLSAWEGYPGEGLDATAREERLLDWAKETLQLCFAGGHKVGGVCEVAKVLARAPGGSDGHWPCLAARQLIESRDYPALSRELDVAKHNLRGVYGKSLGEGGNQEREIATVFQSSADFLRTTWPHTAALLDGLARSYERAGEEEDQEARADLRHAGGESEDFATPANEVSLPQSGAAMPPVVPGIVRLDTVHIKDLCTIENLDLKLGELETDRGQWVVLLGENGSGKTTLLRALALTLTTHNTAVHAYGNLPTDANMVRADAGSASCVVRCSGQDYHLKLTKGLREVDLEQHPNGTTPRPLVFGYGCRRGSAFGGERVAEIEVASRDIATLFDARASLNPAFGWLKDQKRLAMEDPAKQGPIFAALMSGLCTLLPEVSNIDVHGDNVWVTAPALGGQVPMAALSDGYLTTIGWVIDLLASWFQRSEDLRLPVTSKFYEEMTGLVLLDEIDLHLHPRWQLTVIADVRRLFRRMSFVVTTHSPAAVVGAKPGEIWILTNDNGRVSAEQRREPPKLMTGSEIYTSYFGIPHMYPDLAEKMRRYGFLAGKADRTDAEESEVQQLLVDLRTEGVDPGWEPVPREEPRPRRTGKRAAQT
jgi:energy-coupling factor transporter ATP-binding protein EcfA2